MTRPGSLGFEPPRGHEKDPCVKTARVATFETRAASGKPQKPKTTKKMHCGGCRSPKATWWSKSQPPCMAESAGSRRSWKMKCRDRHLHKAPGQKSKAGSWRRAAGLRQPDFERRSHDGCGPCARSFGGGGSVVVATVIVG